MARTLAILCLFFIAAFLPSILKAAAWTQAKGRGQVIDTVSYYATDKYFSTSGYSNTLPQNNFSKLENGLYAEYGLTDGLTIGLTTSYQHAVLAATGGDITAEGFGDIELFLRQLLWKEGNGVLSVQPLLKLPTAEGGNATVPIGTDGLDAELRLLYGYGFQAWGRQHFYDAEIGYRERGSDASNEWHIDETLGIRVDEDVMLMGQLFLTASVEHRPATFTVTNSTDYDLAKAQFSVVTKVADDISVQAGAYDHVAGRNTGAGGGIFLSLWVDF